MLALVKVMHGTLFGRAILLIGTNLLIIFWKLLP